MAIVGRIEIVLAGLILLFIVGMIVVQVILNAGLGNPITWEQEGGAYALVWLTFIGASIGLKQLRHVKIVSFVSSLSARWQSLVYAIGYGVIIWVLIILLLELTNIIPIEGRATTIALPIDVPRSWFFSVPLFITSILMLWTAGHYFLSAFYRFFAPQQKPISAILSPRRLAIRVKGGKIYMIWVLFLILAILVIIEVPIAFALPAAALSYLLIIDTIPLMLVVQRIASGLESYVSVSNSIIYICR